MKKPLDVEKLVAQCVFANRKGEVFLESPVTGEAVLLSPRLTPLENGHVKTMQEYIGQIVHKVMGVDEARTAYEMELVRRVKIAGLKPQLSPDGNARVLRDLGLPVPRHGDFRRKRHMSPKEKNRFSQRVRKLAAEHTFPCGHPRSLDNTVRGASGRAKCAACNSPILQH